MQATVSAEANLTSTLPDTWLPMAKYTPLLEASMRQRGYEVQILVLNSTVAESPAEQLFPHLPTPNTTAFQFVLNVGVCHRYVGGAAFGGQPGFIAFVSCL